MFKHSKLSVAILATLSVAPVASMAQEEEVLFEEVIVRGIASSIERSIDRKRDQSLISDGISAEDLGKFPDNNIADSLQRVPGVAIDRDGGEGRFVSIRGLGPDFTAVQINGRTPASENEERAFSFDTLASELVSTVDVFKTSAPGLKEGGLGGTIDIVTARPFDFDGFKFAGSLKGQYEENSEETSPQGSFIISNTFNDGMFGVLASMTYQKRNTLEYVVRNEHIANTNLEPFLSFTTPSEGWGGGYAYSGDGLEEDTYRIQSIYAGSEEVTRERVGGNLVFQARPTENLTLTADVIYSDYSTSSTEYSTGSYLWAPTLSDQNVVDENGFYQVINHGYDEGYDITGYAHLLTTKERPTESVIGGFNAEWYITDDLVMTADIAHSEAELDNRGLDRLYIAEFLNRPGYIMTSDGGIPTYEYRDEDAIKPEMGSQNMQDLRARITSNDGVYNKGTNDEFKLDFAWDADGEYLQGVKFGINNTISEKQTEYWKTPELIRRMYHGLATGQEIDYDSIITGVQESGDHFGGLNADVYMIDPVAYREWMAENIDGRTRADTATGIASKEAFIENGYSWAAVKSNDSYVIEEDVISAYLELDFEVNLMGMPLELVGGLRYTETSLISDGTSQVLESLERESTGPGEPPSPWLVQNYADAAGTAVSIDSNYDNWLPSLNATLQVTEDLYVRAAVSETLTRPTLSALAPYTTYQTTTVSTRTAMGGNPDLKPYKSTNYDLAFEYYYGDSDILSLAFYQKNIDDYIVRYSQLETIENVAVEDPSWQEFMVTRPHNSKSATIEGAEINITHLFDIGVGVTANYTFVDSSATLSEASDAEQFALPGLSDTGNVSLFYGNELYEGRLAYNYRTDFLGLVFNGPSNEPVHYDAYGTLDFSFSYNITENMSAFIEGINVTGEVVNKYGRYENQFVGYEDTGAIYTFGLRANF
ncbi:TonB-dependent receptor [Gilvimarinus agarilyticus]|uniref:TonB-dependent receptor n=1 Tax=Gilvimarinus sp. 2_MG-2023 TaxID=3062666 RepID=UPI001C0913A1|nr:TonB-dependent receptor [Gilvimarinus sp. 2_MG-2023]MBU2884219.1 TonB-dependent receptor [Gilvimarinus agarilyticus]MDO6569358.1 TonB-dependent receptor [Gilvimarinus sp. 2_MG-2023]